MKVDDCRKEANMLTDDFLLRDSEYFCRNGTRADVGPVAGSGWRRGRKRAQPIGWVNGDTPLRMEYNTAT